MAYEDIADLTQQQSFQSRNIGNTAASLADPFSGERRGYQNQLRQLMANPGEFGSSPAYQFAFDQGFVRYNGILDRFIDLHNFEFHCFPYKLVVVCYRLHINL